MAFIKQMLKALGLTIITFGSSHLLVSYALMIFRNYQEGNLFRILNYQKIFPGIDLGLRSFIISNIIGVGVYCGFLAYVVRRSRKPKVEKADE